MIKRLVLVASVCLTALLISSCSDGTTTSAVYGQAATTSVECDRGCSSSTTTSSSTTSNSSSTTTTTSTATVTTTVLYESYVDKYPDLLAVYNASGGGQTKSEWGELHYNNFGKSEGRTVSTSSTATITDVATTTTAISYESYVDKYPDLLAAYNASVGGQTKSEWGESHYNVSGESEGRTVTTDSSTSTAATTDSDSYESYVDKYPDLLAAYNAFGGGQTKSEWGDSHYNVSGESEGRTLTTSSTTTTTTVSTLDNTTATTTTDSNSYESYVDKYPDLLAAYNASGGSQSKSEWGESHYNTSGEREGRTLTTSSTTTDSTTTSEGTFAVISPNGGETWKQNQTKVITWSSGYQGNAVHIDLYKSNSLVYRITATNRVDNDSNHRWTIPSSLGDSDAYQIEVSTYMWWQTRKGEIITSDKSGYFTIGSSANNAEETTSTETSSTEEEEEEEETSSCNITVTDPNHGNERWDTTNNRGITWTSDGASDHVNIYLYKNDALCKTVTSGTSNNGFYAWINAHHRECNEGSGTKKFQIAIVDSADSTCFDLSDNKFSFY